MIENSIGLLLSGRDFSYSSSQFGIIPQHQQPIRLGGHKWMPKLHQSTCKKRTYASGYRSIKDSTRNVHWTLCLSDLPVSNFVPVDLSCWVWDWCCHALPLVSSAWLPPRLALVGKPSASSLLLPSRLSCMGERFKISDHNTSTPTTSISHHRI